MAGMGKVKINLYPYQDRQENKYLGIMVQYAPFVLLGAGGLILLNIIIFLFTSWLSFPYHRLNKEWKELQPKVEDISSLKKELDDLKLKKKLYMSLVTYKVDISHALADVYASLPKNIWFDRISFHEDTITLVGYAVKWKQFPFASIDRFIKKLRKSEYFSKVFSRINLRSSRRVDLYGRIVMKFEIECKI